ncbi:LacI family DNA-binding transcriptional regulator [Streptomyces alkaliterrae]|uniref:LacI family DNA-binding transcriptional regulator n=1 Tax=Streptomyces alkaliterrae TaxID=2213162 RepID=A0A5P0YKL0_9ACTN|nr:LacI family DNA-binding transcriptional regulator [Streptomyces alkaliterrae]MBB1252587.1 LacI family DNA-binding transcriptional regulator [Streptomyces alkaliterrae]MBB1258591.1 LacI family DNA-binding transcriptional regulator [Streptomyces alkaliterrae]MQS00836.1 LacI family DNA-binding transcriptional regulator [Streptomyces alkaliterrae]
MPTARRPTIRDIARRAGVSESAVSFALNGRPGVSEGTRERVRRVAEQLGWHPSSAARALSGERTGAVGLVLARPASTLGVESFFLQLVSGVQEALSTRRAALLFQVVESLDTECELYRRWWAERRVDGVLVVDPRSEDPRPALLGELGLPAVVVGGGEAGERLSSVSADDTSAMASIIDHLHGLGHRRIVHVAGLPGFVHTERRVSCLRAEAAARGLDPHRTRSVTTDYSDSEGAEATRLLLDEPDPPTAIVYDNDVMAVAGLATAQERSVAVPAELSVVAWDDSPLCRVTHPRLTALVRDTAAFGRLAARELLRLLDGESGRAVASALPRLEPRESTGEANRAAS